MKLRVPSLQHLARNWRSEPALIARELVKLGRHPPTFSYNPLYSAVRDLLMFGQSVEEIERGFRLAIKREEVCDNLLEVLHLVASYFKEVRPGYINAVARRYYPVGRKLMVPFEPPIIYGVDGAVELPWFSFWKTNPLQQENLRLFVTVVREILAQDPDLEDASIRILDFSAPSRSNVRSLRVIDAAGIEGVSEDRKTEMLEIFATGFQAAEIELSNYSPAGKPGDARGGADPDQPDFFDPENPEP